MFRRKEENLFDTATDPNYNQAVPGEAPVNAAPATASSTSSSNGSNGGATGGTSGSGSVPPSGIVSRPATDARPAADSRPAPAQQQATSNFRPNASTVSNDLTRNRLPEAKLAAPVSSAPSALDKSVKAGRRVLTVGNDILLKGEIATCDRLVIEGKVDATLNDVHTVEISENGSFKGSAQIEDAEISGLFEGDLIVRNRLVIYATGRVRGKITYGEIEIERGGELTGEIKTVSSTTQQQTARPARPVQKETVAA